jgi:hypothetical protein
MKLKNPFAKNKLKLTKEHKEHVSNRAKRQVKKLPKEWKAQEYHFIYRKLLQRRKARMVLTHLNVLGLSKRRSVLKLVDAFSKKSMEIEKEYDGKTLEIKLKNEQAIFEESIKEILRRKSKSFLKQFYQLK